MYSDAVDGQKPCRRCIEEQKECILAPSKRGGRRMRRAGSTSIVNGGNLTSSSDLTRNVTLHLADTGERDVSASLGPLSEQASQLKPSGSNWRGASSDVPQPSSLSLQGRGYGASPTNVTSAFEGDRRQATTLDDAVASAEILNPSDALNILVNAASSAQDGYSAENDHNEGAAPSVRDPPRTAITNENRGQLLPYETLARKVGRSEIIQLVEKYNHHFRGAGIRH